MLALFLMLLGTYYAQNYASMIGWCLVSCNNVCDFHNLSHDPVSPECELKCFGAEENEPSIYGNRMTDLYTYWFKVA